MKARKFTAVVTAFLALSCTAAYAFPDKPIVVNGCQPAGGGNDRNMQAIIPFASKYLGETMIAQYRPGAGGTLAMQELKNIEPDGYTLVVCDPGGAIFGPIAQSLKFDADSAIPVARIAFVPWILTVSGDTPYKTLAEFVDAAKADPGKIDGAIADIASADHYAWLRFTQVTGLGPQGLRWVPYGGGAAKLRAMLAGESKADMLLPSLIKDPTKEGKMRPLAVASEKRLADFPDVPTFKELGYDLVEGLSISIFAPPGTSKENVDILRKGLSDISKDPEYREIYARFGQDISGFITGADVDADWASTWKTAPELLRSVASK
jgi:tripartite-type tricarboxylate transporter receptor subunit TctC